MEMPASFRSAGSGSASTAGTGFPVEAMLGSRDPAAPGPPHLGLGIVQVYSPFFARVTGDFDDDGQLSVVDIETIAAAINSGSTDARFNLNADGIVAPSDHIYWVIDLRKTWIGDVNMDGEFNTSDLVEAFQAGEYEDKIEELEAKVAELQDRGVGRASQQGDQRQRAEGSRNTGVHH